MRPLKSAKRYSACSGVAPSTQRTIDCKDVVQIKKACKKWQFLKPVFSSPGGSARACDVAALGGRNRDLLEIELDVVVVNEVLHHGSCCFSALVDILPFN